MAFSVEDFQDLLRLLEEHPQWQADLRRRLLTDELLELPALVRQLAAAQVHTEQRLAELAEKISALTDTVGEHSGEILELRYARRAGGRRAPTTVRG